MEKNTEAKEIDPRTQAICNKIKQLRIEAGYTNYENFAWDLEMSRSFYFKVEKGHNMTIETLLRILDSHEIQIDDFFSDIWDYLPKKTKGRPKKQ